MLKVFAFVFLVFSQSALAESDEIYRCGNNTFQSIPCVYTKNKPASDKSQSEAKPLTGIQKHNKASKPKPLSVTPKVEPVIAPTTPAPPVVTKKPPVAAPPAPKPVAEPVVEKLPVEKPVSMPPVTLPEPAPVKAPEPLAETAAPEPVAEPIKTEEAPTKTQEQLGVCDSLKAGLDNIANQRKNGTGDEFDLNRQQKELENVMKQSGC